MRTFLDIFLKIVELFLHRKRQVSVITKEEEEKAPLSVPATAESETKHVLAPLVTKEMLLMNRVKFEDLAADEQKNIQETVEKINLFFEGFSWPLQKKVNDGYRRSQDKPKNGATLSNHFKGAAVDLDDDDAGTIWKYVWSNRFKLKEIGIWCEHPCWTHCDGMSWMHFQIFPPKSGKRFYIPSNRPNPAPHFWDGKYEKELDS